MFKIHGFLDDKMVMKQRMEHLPRCGDTMRLSGERYAKVTEVIWCMDEPDCEQIEKAQRINLRMESIGIETPNAELSGPRPLAAEGSRSNDVLGAAAPERN